MKKPYPKDLRIGESIKAYDFETDEWTEYEIFAIDGMTDQSEIDKAGYAEDALIGCANEYSEIELNPIDIHRF